MRVTVTNYIDEQAYWPFTKNTRKYGRTCNSPWYSTSSFLTASVTNRNMSDTYETYGVVTDAQTVFTVVVYLGSLLDDDDINVLYEIPAAVGVEVPWIYTENMSTHTRTWEADYRIQISSGSWISTTSVFSSWRFLYLSVPCGTSKLCDFERPWATRLQTVHVLRHCRTKPTCDRMDQRLRLCDQKRINVDLSCFDDIHTLTHACSHTHTLTLHNPPPFDSRVDIVSGRPVACSIPQFNQRIKPNFGI